MSDWEKCAIADLCDSISETYHRNSPNVVLINTSDVLEGNILNHEFVPNKQLKGQFKKTFQKEDILFSEIRPANKRYAFVDIKNTQDYIASTKLMVLRPDKKKVLPMYLYFLLTAKNMLDELQYLAETRSGTFPQITFDSELGTMPVALPDIITQAKIAGILKALDDKIALNQQINKNLEEQAQAIFEEFFGPDIGNLEETKCCQLSELIDTIDNRGKTPPLSLETTDYPIIDVKSLSGATRIINFNNCTKFVSKETYDTWFRSGHPATYDILISTVGSLAEIKLFIGNVGCIAQNVVGLRAKNISPLYLYQYLRYIKNDLVAYDIGSVQPSIKITHIIKHPMFVPDKNKLNQFDAIAKDFSAQIYNNTLENEKFSNLRNELLPRLMSGEIDVSKIEV